MLGALLIPALPFVVPSSEVSLARIWGLGTRRAGQFSVVVSIVRPSQSSADDGADRHGQTSVLVGYRILDSLRCTHRGLTRVHAQSRAANQMQILAPKPASHRTMLAVKTGPRRTRYPKAYVITGTASKAMIAHLL